MENYNEKINYGSKEKPLMRDRLCVNSTTYGFNLFDRKEKINLLCNKSKETCEDGKNILINADFADFKYFKESVKDEEIVTNKILIVKDKYSDDIYSIPTLKDLHKVCLHILEYRFENNFFYKSTLPEELDFTEADIEKMPESFKEEAKAKLRTYLSMVKNAKETNREYEEAENAIKTKNGDLAYSIVKSRSGYEYEDFEIATPKTL